ncbi:DUF4040 family protein [Rhodococcus triatomae]|uniref:Multicomponent Na+:H+ antiporter subunit A n=1 Tax=Rhodococcus triatomae TaxID=300028 RepID=A0A1G8IJ35_9NOCA|nr:DUF4040 family protein [Rhodococcus triatomae]QNG21070.1 DUF4040 family protein [Rhodococcus triatomae]QNG23016.1 DUF4040 family protein [Rhodococcus triatomae]SDI18903.1 multicomponent Na+:H+ antiporter subunit A [Rhodococcus triatomae]
MVLVWALIVLSAAAVAAPFVDRAVGRATGWILAAVFTTVGAVVAVVATPQLADSGVVQVTHAWIPALGIDFSLRLDGTAFLFLVLVLGVGALIMAYSASYFGHGRHGGFYLLMTLFAASMFGLVLADDIVLLFVFWEFTTICSFFLIGRSGARASGPAVRTFLLTGAGGLALLAAVVTMWSFTGTTNLGAILADPIWHENTAFSTSVGILIAVAAFTKSAQFPFHYWLPDAMAAATPVSAYLHAAAMVKAGIYLLMRFSPALGANGVWQAMLIGVGLLTAVLGAVFALQRHDLKELLAYSTVSQLGLIVAVIGVGTPTALAAAGLHTLAHALFKATLFMLVGVIDREVGSRDIRQLTGLWRVMPVTGVLAALSAASMAGIPPLLGFVSKENLFGAYLEAPGPQFAGGVVGAVAVSASILTFAYSFRIVYGAFGGPTTQARLHDPSIAFRVPAAVSSIAGLVLGLNSQWLAPLVDRISLDTQGEVGNVHLALWYGFTPALWMSVTAIAVGSLLFLRRDAVDRVLDRDLFPVRGVDVFERIHAGTIAFGARVGDLTRSQSPTRHLAAPLLVLVASAVAALVLGVVVVPFPEPVTEPVDWLLLVLVAVGVLGVVSTSSRLAALALLGVVGFAVALVFFVLGAPDVGLTQLLVEVLTVVVAVLVLRRLPARFRRPSRMRRNAAAGVAVAAGAAAAFGTYFLTGRRERSPAADYFVAETEAVTGGTNIVNTILVDFRALDTLGELTVLGIAGLVVAGLLDSARLLPTRPDPHAESLRDTPVGSAVDNTLLARTVGRWLTPALIVLSVYLLLRGHYDPGGGFISALVGGAAFALAYLSAPDAARAPIRLPYIGLICSGVALGTAVGLLGYVDGAFLTPLHFTVPLPWGGDYHFTTALVFDLGVYLAVIGIVLASLNRLGRDPGTEAEPAVPTRAARSGRNGDGR